MATLANIPTSCKEEYLTCITNRIARMHDDLTTLLDKLDTYKACYGAVPQATTDTAATMAQNFLHGLQEYDQAHVDDLERKARELHNVYEFTMNYGREMADYR